MNPSIYYILSRKETKIFIVCTVTGGVLQLFCRRYIKNHPEILEEPEIRIEIKNPSGKTEQITDEIINEITKKPRIFHIIKRLRGGLFQEKFAELLLKVIIKKLIKLAAQKGVEIGLSIGLGAALAAAPKKALIKIIEGSLPQNLLDSKGFIQVNGEKIYLQNCDDGFEYALSVLLNKGIPYGEKQKVIAYLFSLISDRIKPLNFIICLISLLLILAILDPASYALLLRYLIEAIKEGKISKRLGRLVVRKLKRKRLLIDRELLDLVPE